MDKVQSVSESVYKKEELSAKSTKHEKFSSELPATKLATHVNEDTTFNNNLTFERKNVAFSRFSAKSSVDPCVSNTNGSHCCHDDVYCASNNCDAETDSNHSNNFQNLKDSLNLPTCISGQSCSNLSLPNIDMLCQMSDLPSTTVENVNYNSNVTNLSSATAVVEMDAEEDTKKPSSENSIIALLISSHGLLVAIVGLFLVFGASVSVLIYFGFDLNSNQKITPVIPHVSYVLNQTQSCGVFPISIYVSPSAPSSLMDFALRVVSNSTTSLPSSQNNTYSSNSDGRVVGGIDANILEYPWQVALFTTNRGMTCGGSIILNNWVLTAAHCTMFYKNIDDWTVYAGMSALSQKENSPAETRKVSQIIQHHDYQNDDTYDYDISLLKLDKDFTYSDVIQPICLPTPNQVFPDGMDCNVSGWGATDPNVNSGERSNYPDILQQAKVDIIASSTCNRPDWYYGLVTDRMLCAGKARGGVDACQGDSGGPLACYDAYKGAWVLAGGVSWGVDCGKPKYPGVYTKISYFTNWIWKTIGKVEGWIPESPVSG